MRSASIVAVRADHLATSEQFAGLDEQTQFVALPAATVLFRQGDPSDDMYVVVRGAIRITACAEDGRERFVALRDPGALVGEMQMLSGGVRSADVHAAGDTELLRVPRAAFDEAATRAPEVLQRLAALIRRRLRREHIEAIVPAVLGPLDEAELERLEAQLEWHPATMLAEARLDPSWVEA